MNIPHLTLAGLVALGIIGAPIAEAAPVSKSKPSAARKTGLKKPAQGGVSLSGQDLDGDGTADVVVRSSAACRILRSRRMAIGERPKIFENRAMNPDRLRPALCARL